MADIFYKWIHASGLASSQPTISNFKKQKQNLWKGFFFIYFT